MKIATLSLIVLTSLLSLSADALVDYTQPEESAVKPSRRAKSPMGQTIRRMPKAPTRSSAPSGMFSVSSGYEMMEINRTEGDASVTKLTLGGHFQTNYNIYLDFNYWSAKSDELSLSKNSDMQNGNASLAVGFNWLRFGDRSEIATVDFFGGVQMDSSDPIASSRTDKFFGIETTKRFHQFALGLGYEYRLSGTTKDELEVAIGNVSILKGTLGWVVSNDIQFVLEAATVKVSASDEKELSLSEDQTYGYIAPSLALGISPAVQVELGAIFQTNRPKNKDELVGAKLFSMDGVYGNTLKAGLNISI